MALQLDFTNAHSADCTELVVTDNTGDYSALNPAGFGTPNTDRSAITSATLDITMPDGTLVAGIVATLPSINPTETVITGLELGLSSGVVLADGVWTIKYLMTDGTSNFSTTKQFLRYCNIQCCLDKLVAQIDFDTDCNCENDLILKTALMQTLLTAAISAASCYKTKRANKLLTNLQQLCNLEDCGCNKI